MENETKKGKAVAEKVRVVTLEYARSRGLHPVTEADAPSKKVETVLGDVRYSLWCERECLRIRSAGRRVAIVKFDDGRLSVWAS